MRNLDIYNAAQRQAVTSDSSVILTLAGAGTGKTSTLTGRIAYLNENRVGTSNMLALTFTRLAAAEMKERLGKLIGEREAKNLFCGTFHSFCVKVIREWGHLVGIEPNFTVYDEADRLAVIEAAIEDLGCKKVKPDDVLKQVQASDAAIPENELGRVVKEYLYRLRQNNALDLDLLLQRCKEILGDQRAQDYYHDLYKYVFVDEYQDTSAIQYFIINRLNPEHLFVVGDDYQGIYGWRGANISNILNFNSMTCYPDAEVIKLEENYRSTAPIVEAANKLIAFNNYQTKKELRAQVDGVNVRHFTSFREESEFDIVYKLIEGHHRECGNYSDCAVLGRTNKQLERLHAFLHVRQIPVQTVNRSNDVFKQPIVKGLFDFIAAVHNPLDNYMVRKAFNYPVPRSGDLQMRQWELEALRADLPLMDVLEHSDHTGAQMFCHMVYLMREKLAETDDAVEVFNAASSIVDPLSYLKNQGLTNRVDTLLEAHAQIENWELVQYKMGEDTSLDTFLKWLNTREVQDQLLQEQADAVKLLTIHAAKGLEFETVIVIGMNQGVFPANKAADLEEERRLFYVALTRAKRNLAITRAQQRIVWGTKTSPTIASQFLFEAGILQGGGPQCSTALF